MPGKPGGVSGKALFVHVAESTADIAESEELNMKIIIEKDTDLKDLEAKVNKTLADLEAGGQKIRDMKYTVCTVPHIRGDRIGGYTTIYSVMIVYSLPYEV